jgi:hypothetical protein
MIRTYVGVKKVQARSMSRGAYNTYRCWTIPEGENPADSGYLVQYPDGYESWSPSEQFEEANIEVTDDCISDVMNRVEDVLDCRIHVECMHCQKSSPLKT